MIIYDLMCGNAHRFEGWFRSGEEFQRQCAEAQLNCPHCGSAEVRRLPSAVAIGSAAGAEPPPLPRRQSAEQGAAGNAPSSPAATPLPGKTELALLYRQLVRTMHRMSEDVGPAFAEEARRMHHHETPERAIRGQATADECEALLDEGIAILPLPALPEEH